MVSPARADVAIIGDGLIGLSTALELSRSGATAVVIGTTRPGSASIAAAGLLIPSLGDLPTAAQSFFADSLARYPAFVNELRAFDPQLKIIEGVIERTEIGDRLFERDGAIDNVRLLAAVRAAVLGSSAEGKIGYIEDSVNRMRIAADGATIETQSGTSISADRVILAAGAWSSEIQGLPRPLPVRPLKGQMIALGLCVLDRAMVGPDVYLVPRGDQTLAGATLEDVGFDLTVNGGATETLRSAAVNLCPPLVAARVTRAWSGIRPATPDMLPILGPDPDARRLLYACGHSKNGILLAPGTAVALAALCGNQRPPAEIECFSIARFLA